MALAPAGVLALQAQNSDTPSLQNQASGSSNVSSDNNAETQSGPTSAATPLPNTSNDNATHTSVTVDGQNISVPANSSLHKVIKNGSSTTTIDISNKSSGNSGSSSNDVKVSSRSSSTVTDEGQSSQ